MINQPLLLVIDVDAMSSSMRDDESFHFYVALALSSRQFGPPRECDDENFHFYGVLITVLLITTRTLDRDRPSRGPGRKAFGYMKHKQKFSWIIRNEYSDWIWPIIVAQDRLREPDTRIEYGQLSWPRIAFGNRIHGLPNESTDLHPNDRSPRHLAPSPLSVDLHLSRPNPCPFSIDLPCPLLHWS